MTDSTLKSNSNRREKKIIFQIILSPISNLTDVIDLVSISGSKDKIEAEFPEEERECPGRGSGGVGR